MMDRRGFVRVVTGAGLVALAPASWWQGAVFASAPAQPGPSPYGPLGAADANGLALPAGFTSRVVATSGRAVGATGHVWHSAPDGGGCIADPDNPGGWIYVSNAELNNGAGGVGALRFAADGSITEAYTILSGTSRNCAGGMTPGGTWLSCEESGADGQVYECTITGPGQGVVRPLLGSFSHEAAAVDPATGDVYLTEDASAGRLYKFVPSTPGDLSAGALFAAVVDAEGAVTWQATSSAVRDRDPATEAFDGGEGVYIGDGVVYFATKGDRRIWEFDLATSQLDVAYDCLANPSGSLNAVDNLVVHHETGDVYVGEDGGNMEIGLMSGTGDNRTVAAFLRIDGHAGSEVTGMAFSPDGLRMYFSSQRGVDGDGIGVTYEVTGPFVTTPVSSEPVTLPIVEGSFVRDGSYANRRFRSPATLQLSFVGSAGNTRRPLLSVPITSVPGPYTSAMLRVTGRMRNGTAAQADLIPVESDWTAHLVRWSNQPAVTGPAVGSLDITGSTATLYEIDVTDHLNALHAANATTAAFGLFQPAQTSQIAQIDGPSASSGQPELVLVPAATDPITDPPVESIRVDVAADSYVRGGSLADTNYGWRRQQQVALNTNDKFTRRAFMSGSMPSLPRPVLSATLRVPGRIGTTTPSSMSVAATAADWTNTGLTWNNQPVAGSVVGTFVMSGADTTWYDVDVTDHIEQLRVDAAGQWSLRITQDEPGPVAYLNANNHKTGDFPHVVVEY